MKKSTKKPIKSIMSEELKKRIEELVIAKKQSEIEIADSRNRFKSKKKEFCSYLLNEIKKKASKDGKTFKELCEEKGFTNYHIDNGLKNHTASIEKLKEWYSLFLEEK